MKGILILAHGSREKSTEKTLQEVVDMVKARVSDCVVETAYLQFSDVNLEAGLDRLAAQGIKEIKVIPYFLFAGVHILEDIPAEINEYLKDNPDMKISMGKTLGAHHKLAEILVERINEVI